MKYRFEITYQTTWMKKATKMLSNLDLDINGVGVKEIMTFNSQKDLKISEVKDIITHAYKCVQCEILHIEGGKIE